MYVDVDLSTCEGHGLCEQTAPDIYEVDDEGFVHLRVTGIDTSQEPAAEAGARVCPVAALTIRRT